MKNIFLFLILSMVLAHAQGTTAISRSTASPFTIVNGSFAVGSGTTETILSGGTFTTAAGATVDLSAGTILLPATVSTAGPFTLNTGNNGNINLNPNGTGQIFMNGPTVLNINSGGLLGAAFRQNTGNGTERGLMWFSVDGITQTILHGLENYNPPNTNSPVTVTGVCTRNSTTISSLSTTTGLSVGQTVTVGPFIPFARIVSINSGASTLVVNNAALSSSPLGGTSSLTFLANEGVRDPGLIKIGNKYIAAYTISNAGVTFGPKIGVATSLDLVTWTHASDISPTAPATGILVPKWFWDSTHTHVYASWFDGATSKFQYAENTSQDGVTWAAPSPYLQLNTSAFIIGRDQVLLWDAVSTNYKIFWKNTGGDNLYHYATNTSLSATGWVDQGTATNLVASPTPSAAEALSITRLVNGNWAAYFSDTAHQYLSLAPNLNNSWSVAITTSPPPSIPGPSGVTGTGAFDGGSELTVLDEQTKTDITAAVSASAGQNNFMLGALSVYGGVQSGFPLYLGPTLNSAVYAISLNGALDQTKNIDGFFEGLYGGADVGSSSTTHLVGGPGSNNAVTAEVSAGGPVLLNITTTSTSTSATITSATTTLVGGAVYSITGNANITNGTTFTYVAPSSNVVLSATATGSGTSVASTLTPASQVTIGIFSGGNGSSMPSLALPWNFNVTGVSTFTGKVNGGLMALSSSDPSLPPLVTTNSTSTGNIPALRLVTSGITGGQAAVLSMGLSDSNFNIAHIAYNFSSGGSTANNIGLGFWGNDNVLQVFGTSAVTSSGSLSAATTVSAGGAVDTANAVWLESGDIAFEGATANAFETRITPTDPTADRTITLPDASGTVAFTTATSNTIATGTVYALTSTSSQVAFGTTSAVFTLPSTGKWAVFASVQTAYSAATFAGLQTETFKIRRTNNTAADVTDSVRSQPLAVVTTITEAGPCITIGPIYYNGTSGDILQVFGAVSATPAAGAMNVTDCSITGMPVY